MSKKVPEKEISAKLQAITETRPSSKVIMSNCVGKALGFASMWLANQGFSTRIVEQDGQTYLLTPGYETKRANLAVQNNIVKRIYIG